MSNDPYGNPIGFPGKGGGEGKRSSGNGQRFKNGSPVKRNGVHGHPIRSEVESESHTGSELEGEKVLVTGAGGFIGSHLTEALIRKGVQVRALLRYNSSNDPGLLSCLPEALLSDVEVVRGDLKDPDSVQRAVEGCRTVFHLGALIAIPYSYINPNDFVQTNVVGTANLLNACRRSDVERIVHTSTSEVYGSACYVPIDEAHPLQTQSPYAASKSGADMLAESYYRSFDLPVVILRPFNTFGPRQSARAIVPTIIAQALVDRPIELGALDPRRDLTYVSDTVEGFLKAAETPDAVGQIINLGTGRDVSIGELVQMVLEVMGKDLPVIERGDRVRPVKSEVTRLQSDNEKARRFLGWVPEVTLEMGLERTVYWVSEHIECYCPEAYQT